MKEENLVFRQTPWDIGRFLRGWQMEVPKEHSHGAGHRALLKEVEPQIYDKLEEEIEALNGVKFQLALKVQLRKDNPDGSEECTDHLLRHKQEAILQKSEIKGALSFPKDPRKTREKDTERVRLGVRSGTDPLARHCQISASSGRVLHPTSSSCKV